MFVLEGTPIIRLQKGKQIKLTKRVWLGEMSFLRGEVTSADVLTEQTERVKLLIWNKHEIEELQEKYPIVIEKLRYIIANSLAEKIRYSNTLIENTFT
jgi:CRP-like cAMP-binding protein